MLHKGILREQYLSNDVAKKYTESDSDFRVFVYQSEFFLG